MSNQRSNEWKKWGVLATTVIASVTVIMNASLQNVAVPQYIETFDISVLSAQWIISLFSLSMLIALTVAPFFAKKYGYKAVFLGGLVLLTAGALTGGFAGSFEVMLVARILQGLGGGLITPISLVLLREHFGVEKQGVAMGLWSFSNMLAPAAGPTVGGLILESSSWHFLFFANIPAIIFCTIATILFIKKNEGKSKEKNLFDWLGFGLVSVGLLTLVFGIEQIQKSPTIIVPLVLFAVAAVSISWFVYHSLNGKQPLLNVRIMKNVLFTASLVIVICCSFTMTSLTFIVPILMQQVLNVGPTISGVATLPHAVMVGIFGIIGGRLLDKYGAKTAVFPGLIVLIAVCGFFFFALDTISIMWIIICIGVIGIGNGMLSTTTVATALSNLSQDELREGASMINISKHIGKVIIVVVVAFILDIRRVHYLGANYDANQAGMAAIQDVYLVLAIFLILMIPVVWLIAKKYKEQVMEPLRKKEELEKINAESDSKPIF